MLMIFLYELLVSNNDTRPMVTILSLTQNASKNVGGTVSYVPSFRLLLRASVRHMQERYLRFHPDPLGDFVSILRARIWRKACL